MISKSELIKSNPSSDNLSIKPFILNLFEEISFLIRSSVLIFEEYSSILISIAIFCDSKFFAVLKGSTRLLFS